MIGTVLYPLWCCAITAATLVVGLNMQPSEPTEAEMPKKVEKPPIYMPAQLLVAPVVNGNKSAGYVFSNVSLEMNSGVRPKTRVPLELIIQDAYLSLIVGNPEFNFPHKEQFELAEFKSGLQTRINESVGAELVRALYVSGINFLGREEARTKQTLRSVWLQEPEESSTEPEPKKKK